VLRSRQLSDQKEYCVHARRDHATVTRRPRVPEYLLGRTEDRQVNWRFGQREDYETLAADEDGIIRSRIFPGLWPDVPALLAMDDAKIMATL
jgi:Uma2 family endonuclease